MKIYTRTGDNNQTTIRMGRVSKNSPIIKTLAYIDDLQTALGFLIFKSNDKNTDYYKTLQRELMKISSIIAGYEIEYNHMLVISLEKQIDELTKELRPLSNFILCGFGDDPLEMYAHACRTKCRILETNLHDETSLSIRKIINRLSDYFFTLCRYYNTNELRFKIKQNIITDNEGFKKDLEDMF